jgi:DNA-binding NtrC family response regulator
MSLERRVLLVVEDDGLIRMDLVDCLADMGFEVLEAANADVAIGILAARPDIVALLTDIDMPGSMNGIALAHLTVERHAGCQIVIISGRYSPEQGSIPPHARFLSKPISERMLAKTLSEIGLAS